MEENPYQAPQAPLLPPPPIHWRQRGAFRPPHAMVVAILMLAAAVSGLTAAAHIWPYRLALVLEQGGTILRKDAELSQTILGSALFLNRCCWLAAALGFLFWQYRAASNLRAFSGRQYRFSPAWAVGWWLVPLANYSVPYWVVQEIVRASDPQRDLDGDPVALRRGGPVWLPLWWLCRVASSLTAIGLVVVTGTQQLGAPGMLLSSMIAAGSAAPALLIDALVAQHINSCQKQKIRWYRSARSPALPPLVQP